MYCEIRSSVLLLLSEQHNQKTCLSTRLLSELTSTVKDTIYLALVKELRVFRLDRFELDGNLFSCGHVGAQVNIAKGPTADLPP